MTRKTATLSSLAALVLVVLVHAPAVAQTELAMLVTNRDKVVEVFPVHVACAPWAAAHQTSPILQVELPMFDAGYPHPVTMVPPARRRETAALNAMENRLSYPVKDTPTLSELALDPLPTSFRVLFSLFMPGLK